MVCFKGIQLKKKKFPNYYFNSQQELDLSFQTRWCTWLNPRLACATIAEGSPKTWLLPCWSAAPTCFHLFPGYGCCSGKTAKQQHGEASRSQAIRVTCGDAAWSGSSFIVLFWNLERQGNHIVAAGWDTTSQIKDTCEGQVSWCGEVSHLMQCHHPI